MFKSKSNLDNIQKILKRFIKTALYTRGEARQDPLLIVYEKEDRVLKRNNELRDAGLRLQDILKVRSIDFGSEKSWICGFGMC